jgi:hypothetical protein
MSNWTNIEKRESVAKKAYNTTNTYNSTTLLFNGSTVETWVKQNKN